MRRWEQEADANLSEDIVYSIQNIARRLNMNKIVLFGSRASRTNWERSDIDLMISERDVSVKLAFEESLENLRTLLIFDVVNERAYNFSEELYQEIMRDGVIIYEKV